MNDRESATTRRPVLPEGSIRPRRLRRTTGIRDLVRETHLTPADMIYPLFIVHGDNVGTPVPSMPGVFQLSIDRAVNEAKRAFDLGIPAVLLFGIPANKDENGSESCAADGIIQMAIRAIKKAVPDLIVIADLCLCEYTDHGHCGVLDAQGNVDNDGTLVMLRRIALSQAESGADIVAPSGMIDGMVTTIRDALDSDGYWETGIISYAVKYASAFYGPFRDAAQGAPKFGDRRTHQMDPANGREAIREAKLDAHEGADMLMVKPALPYLDVIRTVRDSVPELPLLAYHVSGEYSMIKAASAAGWLDEQSVVMETLLGIKRAGADAIITYFALEAAQWLNRK